MIDKNSIIHKDAKISETAEIGPYVVIGPNVEIGNNVKIHSHVNISGYTKIGDETLIISFGTPGSKPKAVTSEEEPDSTSSAEEANTERFKVYDCVETGTADKTKFYKIFFSHVDVHTDQDDDKIALIDDEDSIK